MSQNNKFMHGTSLLLGDNTIPGLQVPDELQKLLPTIFKKCREFGLDFYPTVIQMLTYDEISEIAAYGGFPVRWPHWQWGMEYEELQRGYVYGQHRIYEMVVNTNPCYIYCLDSNSLVDNVTVVAHALGHCDFFKNNVFFSPTSQNMMNQLANNGTRIRRYMARWGKERVTEFIDHCLRIETLVDFSKAWDVKKFKDPIIRDTRVYQHPKRLDVGDHDYMEHYINTDKWTAKQQTRIERRDAAKEIGIFKEPSRDIMGHIRDHAPLKPWQSDIIAMLYQESIYFAPQRLTKMLNEGWASYIDFNIMAKGGLVSLGQDGVDHGIVEYSKHKMGVLGGKYSTNPYKLGYCLLQDIEDRWNKGRFGTEYDECDNLEIKRNWDRKTNLGREKVFEVRKHYNDLTALMEFFTPEFCAKYEFFKWTKMPNGDVVLSNRKFPEIRKSLIQRSVNGGLPEIRLVDPNHRGQGTMMLEHVWQGQELKMSYTQAVLQSIHFLWGKDVYLCTRDKFGKEVVICCYSSEDGMTEVIPREDYEKNMDRPPMEKGN